MRFLLSILAVIKKELAQISRDRRMLGMVIAAPIMQVLIFGYAIDLDVDRIPTVVCDQDRTEASRALVSHLFADSTFRLHAQVPDPDSAQQALQQGDAAVAFIIPRGFALRTGRADDPQVQVLVDGTDTSRAQVASSAASQFLMLHGIGLPVAVRGPTIGPSLTPRILFNQRLKTPIYMLPGIAATLLLNLTALQMAMGLARERELGTMEQILVTPLHPLALLVGKCLPYVGFGLIDVMACLLLGSYLFDVPMRGPFTVVLVGSSLYLFSTLGIGILIASASSTQQDALLATFAMIIPFSMLSGFMSPVDAMPSWLRPFTQLNPMRHFIEIMRGCLIKGAGLADLAHQLVALLAIGTTVLGVSVWRFSRRLS